MEIKTDFLAYFHHRKKIVMHTQKKTGLDLRLIANHPVFQFETEFFQSLFLVSQQIHQIIFINNPALHALAGQDVICKL